jgi:hypothetical protein
MIYSIANTGDNLATHVHLKEVSTASTISLHREIVSYDKILQHFIDIVKVLPKNSKLNSEIKLDTFQPMDMKDQYYELRN